MLQAFLQLPCAMPAQRSDRCDRQDNLAPAAPRFRFGEDELLSR
jgi:hypothetical protein